MASSQPSGAARSQEMRERFPFSSLVWQVPHFAITSGSVTGMPSSGFSWAAGAAAGGPPGACACAKLATSKTARAAKPASFVIVLSFAMTFFHNSYSLESQARTKLDRSRRSEEHTSELQSRLHLVCRLLLEKKKIKEVP